MTKFVNEEEGVQLKDRKRPMGKPFLQCFSGTQKTQFIFLNTLGSVNDLLFVPTSQVYIVSLERSDDGFWIYAES